MKKLFVLFALLFPASILAADLPPLDADFPDAWNKIGISSCAPETGLVITVYAKPTDGGLLKTVTTTEKGGERISQLSMVVAFKRNPNGQNTIPVNADLDVLVGGTVLSFNMLKDSDHVVETAMAEAHKTSMESLKECMGTVAPPARDK